MGQYVEHFARVDDCLAVLQATTPALSETVLEQLANTMRVRAPSYFTGG